MAVKPSAPRWQTPTLVIAFFSTRNATIAWIFDGLKIDGDILNQLVIIHKINIKRKSVSLLLPIRLSPVNFRYDWLCEWNQQKKLKRKRKPPVRVGPVKESYTQLINYRCEDNRFSCGFIILQKWKTEVLVLKKETRCLFRAKYTKPSQANAYFYGHFRSGGFRE